jgi:hypothetical protein
MVPGGTGKGGCTVGGSNTGTKEGTLGIGCAGGSGWATGGSGSSSPGTGACGPNPGRIGCIGAGAGKLATGDVNGWAIGWPIIEPMTV